MKYLRYINYLRYFNYLNFFRDFCLNYFIDLCELKYLNNLKSLNVSDILTVSFSTISAILDNSTISNVSNKLRLKLCQAQV